MPNPYANLIVATLTERLSAAVGEAAQSDAGVRKILKELQNRTMLFEFLDLNRQFGFHIVDCAVYEADVSEKDADLVIKGTIVAIIKAFFSDNRNPTRIEGVDFYGDMKLAQNLYQVLHTTEFDWEELLAKKTGDVPARHIGNLLRWSSRNLIGADSTLATGIRAALIDDKRLLPPRSTVDKFLEDVDTLQASLDRLEKRAERLERPS